MHSLVLRVYTAFILSTVRGELHAAHESPRTTKLYDSTSDEITLDEIERILI